MSIRLRLTLLLMFLFTSAIGNTTFIFMLESYGEDKLQWVIHTHEVIIESEKLLSTMTAAETGQRGFLLTRNPSYLEPYHSSVFVSKTHIEVLKALTIDNLSQVVRLKKISASMEKKFKELEATILLSQQGQHQEALRLVQENLGKKYMDSIRAELLSFKNAELLLLEKRKGDFRESKAQVTTLIVIEIVFFIFMGFLTAFFVKWNLFNPLNLLMSCTEKMEKGEKQNIADLLPNDEMGYLLSRFYQMSEKVMEETELLTYSASHDELTGLKNRSGIYNEINESILSLGKKKSKLAVIFIDLNKFKQLNDTLGHDAGDFILKETAERLEDAVRSEDLVFRLGGDEFMLVIKNLHDVTQAENVVTKIISRFEAPALFNGHSIAISLSIGIAIAPDDSTNADEMMKLSDIAMYQAKRDKEVLYKFFDKTMLKRESDVSAS